MFTIVPLAGPDFYHESYGIKALYPIETVPLIKKALTSRCWNNAEYLASSKIIFVLRQHEYLDECKKYLRTEFKACQIVEVSDFTRGALCSCLCASGMISDFTAPIVIDLVDILYEANFSPKDLLKKEDVNGIVPWFYSQDQAFSYLEMKEGNVHKAVEKQVISSYASAGTYFFKNLNIMLEAFSQSIKNAPEVSYKNNLFVCPAFSYLDGKVIGVEVKNPNPISKKFKF